MAMNKRPVFGKYINGLKCNLMASMVPAKILIRHKTVLRWVWRRFGCFFLCLSPNGLTRKTYPHSSTPPTGLTFLAFFKIFHQNLLQLALLTHKTALRCVHRRIGSVFLYLTLKGITKRTCPALHHHRAWLMSQVSKIFHQNSSIVLLLTIGNNINHGRCCKCDNLWWSPLKYRLSNWVTVRLKEPEVHEYNLKFGATNFSCILCI